MSGKHLIPPGSPELTLAAGAARLTVAPDRGGSVTGWQVERGGRALPLLHPGDPDSADPFSVACFPLVPWSNRVSGGGFEAAPGFVPLQPNRPGEQYPIHGHGCFRPWRVATAGADRAELVLESAPGDRPWHYLAVQRFTLAPERLTIELAVDHLGPAPMPYGLGLHPFFPRTPRARLAFAASGVWEPAMDLLPAGLVEPVPAALDFAAGRPLQGDARIDHGFAGWNGVARVEWPEHGLALAFRSRTAYLHLYRPPGLPFFALEPVTHPVDAFHLPGRPGLVVLAAGERLALVLELVLEELEPA